MYPIEIIDLSIGMGLINNNLPTELINNAISFFFISVHSSQTSLHIHSEYNEGISNWPMDHSHFIMNRKTTIILNLNVFFKRWHIIIIEIQMYIYFIFSKWSTVDVDLHIELSIWTAYEQTNRYLRDMTIMCACIRLWVLASIRLTGHSTITPYQYYL